MGMRRLRTGLFYGLWGMATVFWSVLIIMMVVLPYRWRHRIATGWGDTTIWLARWVCGIRWQVHGLEHLQGAPAVIVANHQSTWETMFLPLLVRNQVWVLKKELLQLPIFGWAMALLRPIAIDRKQRRQAMEKVIVEGRARLADGFWVVMYPEGTRSAVDNPQPFKAGASRLAHQLGVRVIPIAHNAGQFWPKKGLMCSGTVQVCIGAPIAVEGLSAVEINERAQAWVADKREQLVAQENRRRGEGADGG